MPLLRTEHTVLNQKIQDSFGGKWGKMTTESPAGVVAAGLISVERKNGMTAALGKEVRC